MGRLPYVQREDLPEDKRWLLASLADDDDEPGDRKHSLPSAELNVHKVLANNPELHEAFRDFGSTIWQSGGLTPRDREFVILSTAHQIGAAYEWQQHVRIALDEGIPEAHIQAVSSGDLDELAPEHAAIVRYVRHFVDSSIDDEVHDELASYYDDETVLGIGMLTGVYIGFGKLIEAHEVELEVDFVGWDLENL